MYSSKFLTAPIGTSQEISILPNENLKIDAFLNQVKIFKLT
jgi:hypothetical protein